MPNKKVKKQSPSRPQINKQRKLTTWPMWSVPVSFLEPECSPSLLNSYGNKVAKPFKFPRAPYEYKIIPLRECPAQQELCDTPDLVAAYWRLHVPTHPYYDPERECMVCIILNTRRRVKGYYLISIGTLDTLLVHPREVFRLAVVTSAAAIVLVYNHPSGDPCPSEGDLTCTRTFIKAGQLLKIEVLDHVIMGASPKHCSLRGLGYFAGV